MTKLLWDQVGNRFFETGVDRGVLYLPGGSVVPWNGLTAIEEDFGGDKSSPYFLDGIKYLDTQESGDFSATIKALTYPDEFLEYDGVYSIGNGIFADDQPQKQFNLSYRTLIGNDISGTDLGYKIHLVYNLYAVQNQDSFQSLNNRTSAMEFSWKVYSTPESAAGYVPTSHVVIDSTRVNPFMLEDLEAILYGTATTNPRMPSLSELVSIVINWALISITDNGDGTWTATTTRNGYITMLDATTFQITQVDATYVDVNTYNISSTDTPQGA